MVHLSDITLVQIVMIGQTALPILQTLYGQNPTHNAAEAQVRKSTFQVFRLYK